MLDPHVCEKARLSRDARFDGLFFIGVQSTGIYCRPICPARSPKPENIVYYPSAAAAAAAGLRPCRRCRPESSPGTPAWNGTSTTVARAMALIQRGALNNGDVETLAGRVGVGSRHLRRLFKVQVGVSPLALAMTHRLFFAKKLIHETPLSFTEIAFAAGFGSIRRFNAAFAKQYGASPSAFRRRATGQIASGLPVTCELVLPYRPPYDWRRITAFFWDGEYYSQTGSLTTPYGMTVKRILGIGQSVRSLEHMNRSMAKEVTAFRESQEASPPQEKAPILVISADGKGVPMRREREEPANRSVRRQKGEKANKKRMACVGAVYTIEPFVRSSDEVVNEVMRKDCQQNRPIPQNKQVRAELTRAQKGQEVNAKDAIFSWFSQQIAARNRGQEKHLVCLMDGERALWQTLEYHVTDAVCILDLFHVMERLWTAAHCFYPENSDEAEAFVTARLERILQGDVGRVIGGLKQMATKNKLVGERKKRLGKVIGYLQNNRPYMAYDDYLAKGYPIGSGVVEGACRHLVKDRMELTGMRWVTEGAQAMLDLRATYLNGDWDNFQQHRIDTDYHKLYPYRNIVEANWLNAAPSGKRRVTPTSKKTRELGYHPAP